MFKISVDKNKIKAILSKIPGIIACHAFFSCLVLFLLAFAFGILIFNKHKILSNSADFERIEPSYILDYKAYNSVLENYKKEKQKFEKAELKEYINPFGADDVD